MFGALELSIEEDYDPMGFCFAYKDFDGAPINIKIQQDTQEVLFELVYQYFIRPPRILN